MRQLLLGLLIILTACTVVADEPAIDEAGIYTAVVEQIYTNDDTFGGTLQPATVYLIGRTDDGAGDPGMEHGPSQLIDEATRLAIVAQLAGLPAKWTWVESREEVPINPDNGSVAGEGAIITLGNINAQADGTVQVAGSIYVASLAAGGRTYILQQTDAGWTVTGTTGPAWIS